MSPPVLELRDVRFRRGDNDILRGVDWAVQPGQHWAILGPNGSGKTTLLRVATGYAWPTGGAVAALGARFGHVDLRQLRRRIGWASSALQEMIRRNQPAERVVLSGAFASAAVFDEVSDAQQRRAAGLLDSFGCANLRGRAYGLLSMGEQQRVLIARALMPEPELLILDEPCAGLDLTARERLLRRIDAFAAAPGGPTLVLVTHHVEEIIPRVTHVLLLRAGEVLAAGPKEQVLTGKNLSELYELGVEIHPAHGRFWARVAGDRTHGAVESSPRRA